MSAVEALGRQGLLRAVPLPTAAQLLSRVDEVVRRGMDVVHQLRRNGVDVLGGRASFVDGHTVRVDSAGGSRDVTAANIVIAVGTLPAAPPGVPVTRAQVQERILRHLDCRGRDLPRRHGCPSGADRAHRLPRAPPSFRGDRARENNRQEGTAAEL